MRPSLYGINIVDIGVHILLIVLIIGHCHLNGDLSLVILDMNNIVQQIDLTLIDETHKLLETILGIENLSQGISFLITLSQISKGKAKTGIQEGQLSQAVC